MISYVEENESRHRRGRRKSDVAKMADVIVVSVLRGRNDARLKSQTLDFLQDLLDLTKPQVKTLRSSVDRRLRQGNVVENAVVYTKEEIELGMDYIRQLRQAIDRTKQKPVRNKYPLICFFSRPY